MRPADLQEQTFSKYPPEARAIALQQLALFRKLPLGFLPLLLRELVTYDWKFPAERLDLDRQLKFLSSQPPGGVAKLMTPFESLRLTPDLETVDWVNVPAEFSERLSAYLWSSHQIDSFRSASVEYIRLVNDAEPVAPPAMNRLSMVVIGAGASGAHTHLFTMLRPHGVHYTNIETVNASLPFLETLKDRAAAHAEAFMHWHIDGASAAIRYSECTYVSYSELQPICRELQARMLKVMSPGGGGPELLRSELQRLRPEDVGFSSSNPVLSRFQLTLLTEGSGTQIFSTTFVQWAARETLRRAQPYTLLAHFAPRRRDASIGMPSANTLEPLDPEASLVDADMGAYYTWINQQRLPGADHSSFVVWHEGHNQAVAIGPSLRKGSQETRLITTKEILDAALA